MGDVAKEKSTKHLRQSRSPIKCKKNQRKAAQTFPRFEDDDQDIKKIKDHKAIKIKTSGATDIKAKADDRSLSISAKHAYKDMSKDVSVGGTGAPCMCLLFWKRIMFDFSR